jgi:LPXTG-motif cell wall-anchored protein
VTRTHAHARPAGRVVALFVLATLLASSLAAPPAASADTGATIDVSKTAGLDPAGETITVTGHGFTTTGNLGTRPPLRDQPAGVYVVFTHAADTWRPSQGAPTSARPTLNGEQEWVLPAGSQQQVPGTVLMGADGGFQVELTVTRDEALETAHPDRRYAVIVYPGSGAVNPEEELMVPLQFATENDDDHDDDLGDGDGGSDEGEDDLDEAGGRGGAEDGTDTDDDQDTGEDEVATRFRVVGGQLDWGVRDSFRSYVLGPIASGSIESTDGASTNDDGTFRFPVLEGGIDTEDATLVAQAGGTVSFIGHVTGGQPLLELTISDPRVEVDGDRAVLIVDAVSRSLDSGRSAAYPGVTMATLDLSAFPLEDARTGTLELTDVPATLTAEGAPAFGGFYEQGAALDVLDVALELEATDEDVVAPGGGVASPPADGDVPGFDAGGAGSGATTHPPILPETGARDTVPLIAFALALLALGATVLRSTKRHDPARTHLN